MSSLRLLTGVAALVSLSVLPNLHAVAWAQTSQSSAVTTAMDARDRERAWTFAESYKAFMHAARTELTTVEEVKQRAERREFRPWRQGAPLEPGARYHIDNRGRSIALVVIGRRPVSEGVNVTAAHIDSPRLELKARPLYEAEGFGLFQTSVHGNILTYQWANIPLALVGRIDRPNGTAVQVSIGLQENDPVFVIPALSPHVDIDQRGREQREVLMAEELDPIIAVADPDAERGAVDLVLDHLTREYDVTADDLVSSELALVPALPPRDVGFDRALMAMYGQDDRFSAYAAVRALLDLEDVPSRTSIVYLADNEEVGNTNNTGAASSFLRTVVSELLLAELGHEGFRDIYVDRTMRASRGLSLDVNDGVNPTWPDAWEPGNAPRLGQGINLKMYGQGMNPNSEYAARFRGLLQRANVPWQTATYKVGRAGGGTLGRELSRFDMDVIDVGAPVLSIHSTYDISSKADLWWLYLTNQAFFMEP